MFGTLRFNDVDALRAYRAPQLGAIARGRTFLLGNTALRVQWDSEASEPHLQVVGHAVMGDGEPAIAPMPPWRPQWIWRQPPPAAGTDAPADYRAASAWLADGAVRGAMRHAVTQSHIYATEAEFARALNGQFCDVVLDHLAMGFPFTVGGNQGRIVWRGKHARVVPHRARHDAAPLAAVLNWLPPSVLSSPSQREWCARLEQMLQSVPQLARHRHLGDEPCLSLLEQFGPGAAGPAVASGARTSAAPSADDPSRAALQQALARYAAEADVSPAERQVREHVVVPKLLALWANQGNALTLYDLHLSAVPDVFGAFPQLQHVGLDGNALATLPPSLRLLQNLWSLSLSGNAFAALPEPVRGLLGLTRLDVSGNAITAVPDWIGELPLLAELILAGNRITALPESMGNLAKLARLDLRCNRVADLPLSMARLPTLRSINWIDNAVVHVPAVLEHLSPSCFVDLRGNPAVGALLHPPRRVDSVQYDVPR